MIFGSKKAIPIGTLLIPNENKYDYMGVTDNNGKNHPIPAMIIREATREEYLEELRKQGVELNALTWSEMNMPGYKYYDISID